MTINIFGTTKGRITTLPRGFTLVETLVALSILLIAVVTPITLIGDSLHKMYFARDEAIAVNIAQEGIEMVRQVRDTNMINNVAWDTNLSPGTYIVDVGSFIATPGVPSSFVIPCAGCNQTVYLDTVGTGLYRQGAASTPTQFSRSVVISNPNALAYERSVVSTVTWKTGGLSGSIVLQEYIYKWAMP